MHNQNRIPNKLINETSPYLLQHAYNPVNWFSWSNEAFEKAKKENKPIFLSVGYSTCHWCHVMEQESFEDSEVAQILNENFVAIKVDKEERPDIDSVYMSVCQTLTGSGGWPLTVIMTPDQKPFFAGTYFPKYPRYGAIGLLNLLLTVDEKWNSDREKLIQSGNEIVSILKQEKNSNEDSDLSDLLVDEAIILFKKSFDKTYGGFGSAPKFPTPHHLLFLLKYYKTTKDNECLQMVEKTLVQMYKGGIFDHIGFGFSRYSTDDVWLVPHFEKMLYDNALLTIAYLQVYDVTQNGFYKMVAVKIMDYILKELTSEEGGFFCAQDADSDGIEGKYYVFTPDEIISLLGKEDGMYVNQYFDITSTGNFEGKSIPNLIKNTSFDDRIERFLPIIYQYRKSREHIHKDDKILTSWNALMISAFSLAFKILKDEKYLDVAKRAIAFIEKNLLEDTQLFVSYRDGKKSNNGFLDDYAFYISALIHMYEATLDKSYIEKAIALNNKTINDFYDTDEGGFFLYSKDSEDLILRPKDTYDGAIPSGNSVMCYNLLALSKLMKNDNLEILAQKQMQYMSTLAKNYPIGYSYYMFSLLTYIYPPKEIVCVLKNREDLTNVEFPTDSFITIMESETKEYPLKNNKTTFYICENNHCLPPTNTL